MEIDALPPEVLNELYADALRPFMDMSTFEDVMAREAEDREALA